MLVRVVAKKYRLGLRMSSDDALRPGWAMQGLKPVSFLVAVTARLKPCPVTKLLHRNRRTAL
jgi:hypothetical protein